MGLGYLLVPFNRVGIHDIYNINTEKYFFYCDSEKEVKLKVAQISTV